MMWRVGLSILAGGLLALCYAPFGQSWLVWVVFLLLFPALWTLPEKKRGRRGFCLGYLAGLVFWIINVKWLWTVAGLGAVGIAAYLAVYFGVFGAYAARAGNPWLRQGEKVARGISGRFVEARHSLGYALVLGLFWCGLEWVRGWMVTGFGWNGLGATFADSLILAQSAEWVGVYGLSFLPVFFSAVMVQVGRRFVRQVGGGVRLLHWDFAVALAVVAGLLLVGALRMGTLRSGEVREVRVLLVQQDIPQYASKVAWEMDRVYQGYEELTLSALKEIREESLKKLESAEGKSGDKVTEVLAQPDWIIWPEAALMEWIPVADGEYGIGKITDLLLEAVRKESAATLMVGGYEMESEKEGDYLFPLENGKVWNSLMAVSADREIKSYYKRHLVLFGETLPDFKLLRWLYRVGSGVEYVGNFAPGTSRDPLEISTRGEIVSVIPSVCFEDTVPRLTRQFVRPEAQAIVNITNDGWFFKSEAAAQHFNNARFRAIELRRPMVRCANTGVSGVISVTGSTIDPYSGQDRRLLDENGSHFTRDWLFASMWVPEHPVTTLYAIWGDWFSVFGLTIALAWWAFSKWKKKRNDYGMDVL